MDSVDKLRATVDSFCRYLEGLPLVDLQDKPWGPKEVLAHLLFYHENFAQQTAAQLNGKSYILPAGRLHDLNASAVKACRGTSVEELLTRFQQADEQLRQFAQTYDANTIYLYMKQGSVKRTLAGVIVMVEGHIRGHHQALECGEQAIRIVDKLQATVDTFCEFVRELPASAAQEQAWGPKEVVAHLAFYHESFVAQVTGLVAQQPVEPPKGRQNDLNAQIVEASRETSLDELLHRLLSAEEHLRGLAQTHDAESLTFEIRRGAGLRTLEDVMRVAESHIRNHHLKLKKAYHTKKRA